MIPITKTSRSGIGSSGAGAKSIWRAQHFAPSIDLRTRGSRVGDQVLSPRGACALGGCEKHVNVSPGCMAHQRRPIELEETGLVFRAVRATPRVRQRRRPRGAYLLAPAVLTLPSQAWKTRLYVSQQYSAHRGTRSKTSSSSNRIAAARLPLESESSPHLRSYHTKPRTIPPTPPPKHPSTKAPRSSAKPMVSSFTSLSKYKMTFEQCACDYRAFLRSRCQ